MNDSIQIGIAGLAVMGENLALNMANKGFSVSVYNRTLSKVDTFLAGRSRGTSIRGYHSVEHFVRSLKRPRKVMMMLKAGEVVDLFIDQLLPFMEEGDVIIDGGNTHYHDTIRRVAAAESRGLKYIGTGVSGGEEGALNGPSIMPGGSRDAWPLVAPVFQAISAKADDNAPCCAWMGNGGAGHFVKMVHNGIEYGDMQLICESYHLMKQLLALNPDEMHQVFTEWNRKDLSSYLIEITSDILAFKDEKGMPLIDHILDTAGQKGTGKWTVTAALDHGIPLSLISESVFARCISSRKAERIFASTTLTGPDIRFTCEQRQTIRSLEQALFCAKIISYTQGFALMRKASDKNGWGLDFGAIARIWRGGCIIRSRFLDKIDAAYQRNSELENLLFDEYFTEKVNRAQADLRRIVATAAIHGIAVPCLSAALSYFDSLRSARLPANLLQAQRDCFGAHTYERIDQPRGQFFHTDWTGRGGNTTSTAYNK
jgi:6-phosphogluconate dehydrogenase